MKMKRRVEAERSEYFGGVTWLATKPFSESVLLTQRFKEWRSAIAWVLDPDMGWLTNEQAGLKS